MRKTLIASTLFRICLSVTLLFLIFHEGYSQCLPIAPGYQWNSNSLGCAPFNAAIQLKFLNATDNTRYNVNWGDGSPIQAFIQVGDGVANCPLISHTFPAPSPTQCGYVIRVEAISGCNTSEREYLTIDAIVWTTDVPRLQEDTFRVCEGVAAAVQFRDNSVWNCTPRSTRHNSTTREVQWDYLGGTITGATPATPSSGPRVPTLGPTLSTSSVINVPNTATVGQFYEVRLNNWNFCNGAGTGGGTPVTTNGRILIVPPSVAGFNRHRNGHGLGPDNANFCANERIYLTNTSTIPAGSNNQYTWTYFNAANAIVGTASGLNVTHSFSTSGTYRIRLSVTDLNAIGGCVSQIDKIVNIIDAPNVSIAINGNVSPEHEFCKTNNFLVNLTGAVVSSNSFSYTWTFYANSATLGSPDSIRNNTTLNYTNVNYSNPGIYNIRFTATDGVTGCQSITDTKVIIYDRPVAAFNSTLVCAGTPTDFNNISRKFTAIPNRINNDSIISWEWDFNNDGTIDLTRTVDSDFSWSLPSNVASLAGTYNVTLRVTTAAGCSHSITRQVKVKRVPNPSFNTNPVNGEVCSGNTITFSNTTPANPIISTYAWDFGPYATPATFAGATPGPVTFTNTGSVDLTYNAKLTVTTDSGCTNTFTKLITIHPAAPILIASDYNASQNCSPVSINFTHNGIPADITNYTWRVTNLSTSAVQNFSSGTNSVPFDPGAGVFVNNTTSNVTYSVVLIATYTTGCPATSNALNILVKPNPVATFTIISPDLCSPRKVNFVPTASNADFYSWTFQGGNIPTYNSTTPTVPAVTFTNFTSAPVTYNISLKVSYNSCSDSISQTLTVNPQPEPKFNITGNHMLCAGESLPFTIDPASISGAAVSQFVWMWGDGTPNDTINVPGSMTISHAFANNTYDTTKSYQVRLLAIAQCPTLSAPQTVVVEPRLDPQFNIFYSNLCSPVRVTLVSQSKGPFIASDITWYIDGVAQSVKGENVTYTLVNSTGVSKTFDIMMEISSSNNCKRSITKQITVSPEVNVDFSFLPSKIPHCSPVNFDFTNLSTGPAVAFYWDFNDGTRDTTTTTLGIKPHIFYNGSPNPINYLFKLTAVTADNCKYSKDTIITVLPTIVADFFADTAGCSPHEVVFYNTSLQADSYLWDVGDGSVPTSGVIPPSQIYINNATTIQTFTVTLVASRTDGCDSVIQKFIKVYPEPKPSFTVNPAIQYLPSTTISVVNTTVGDFWRYEWDFGDGSPHEFIKDPDPHSYESTGRYRITLTISNKYCKEFAFQDVAIYARKPIADFDPGNIRGCKPKIVNFINRSLYADSTKYEWDFGDGKGRSTLVNPVYTYDQPGEYSVRLIARNYEGTADDTIKIGAIQVYDIPHASFLARPAEVYLPDKPVYFTNQSLGANSYLWDFGDGSTSTDSDPAHIYLDSGLYTITLTSINQDGCADTARVRNAVRAIYGGRVLIPNAFTPNLASLGINSSEDNDYFFPKAEGVVTINLTIYNRWGEIMYHTKNRDDKGWDGYYKGKLCEQDVYVYTVTIKFGDGKVFNKTGDVVLLR